MVLSKWEITLLQINNPCEHTGFESAVCEICGYPDPRKVIEKLKEENRYLKKCNKYYEQTNPGSLCQASRWDSGDEDNYRVI